MIALFDFPPKHCPSCGASITPNNIGTDSDIDKCAVCGSTLQIVSTEDLIQVLVIANLQAQGNDDYELSTTTRILHTDTGLPFRYLKFGEFAELALIIDPKIQIDRYRNGLSELRLEAEKLEKKSTQGISLSIQFNYEYQQLYKDKGWSRGSIARQLNFDLLVCLVRVIDTNATHDSQRIGINDFISLLRATRMKSKNILNHLAYGLESVIGGKAPWGPKKGPVNYTRVRGAIDAWEKDFHTGKVTSTIIERVTFLPILWSASLKNGYWKSATNLLRDQGLDTEKDSQKRLELCNQVIESSK
jgi:hypothetical protein